MNHHRAYRLCLRTLLVLLLLAPAIGLSTSPIDPPIHMLDIVGSVTSSSGSVDSLTVALISRHAYTDTLTIFETDRYDSVDPSLRRVHRATTNEMGQFKLRVRTYKDWALVELSAAVLGADSTIVATGDTLRLDTLSSDNWEKEGPSTGLFCSTSTITYAVIYAVPDQTIELP